MLFFSTQLYHFLKADSVNSITWEQWVEFLGTPGFLSQRKYRRINYSLLSQRLAQCLPHGFWGYPCFLVNNFVYFVFQTSFKVHLSQKQSFLSHLMFSLTMLQYQRVITVRYPLLHTFVCWICRGLFHLSSACPGFVIISQIPFPSWKMLLGSLHIYIIKIIKRKIPIPFSIYILSMEIILEQKDGLYRMLQPSEHLPF